MASVFQVGAGSGGMPVLDLLCRDPRVSRVTLVEPDVYKPHNVERHLFGRNAVGRLKAELAREWLAERCPHVEIELFICDLLDPLKQDAIESAVRSCDVGVCAADNEVAKFHFDALMRGAGKPWTLGEVLSGGIGGFVHWFRPGGACYGCVASHFKRSTVAVETPQKAPDYSQPGGPVHETTIPASKASIHAIAALHALVTLGLLESDYDPGFTSLLLTLQRVPGVFTEPFKPHRFRIARQADCLVCGGAKNDLSGAELDQALDQALDRLAHE